jgi:hypothetical protein
MKRTLLTVASAALVSACGSSSSNNSTPTGQITLSAAAPFGPHAGETMRAALVRVSDNTTLDIQKATVAAVGTAFSFTFVPVVDLSAAYKVRYWVDFNSNDLCDPPPTDHQWEADVPSGQSSVVVTHNTTFTSVCSTFTFPLTFTGTASFAGPHNGQAFKAALVKGSATTALDTQSGTVGATGFSVTFVPKPVIGEAYSVKLWIDSNFAGGTVGVCDPPPTDHQWSVDIPHDLSNYPRTAFTYDHNTTFTDVCSFFP